MKDLSSDLYRLKKEECKNEKKGINFDRSRIIWMVSPPTGEIIKVEENKLSIVETYEGHLPVGAKFHKDGRLFVTDVTGKLYAYDPDTRERTTIIESYNGKPLNGLNDLVFDQDGGLYFTEPMGSSATKPPKDAGTFTTNLTFHNGYLYVTESLKNEVWRIKVKKEGLQPYGLQ
jgi:sugar lactone lactonase YvrE